MAKYFSLVLLLASIWTTRLLVQGSLRAEELSISGQCRLRGVVLVSKKTNPQLNFTEAQEACRLVGLTLASKDQIEAAWEVGFETCSYGWVKDQFLVISRIFANPKCGKNGKGVLIWRNSPNQKFRAYCYNSSDHNKRYFMSIHPTINMLFEQDGGCQTSLMNSERYVFPFAVDIWINSCQPEVITTNDPIFSTEMATHTTEMTVRDSTYSASSAEGPYSVTQTVSPVPALASTSTPRKRNLICITEAFMETSSMSTKTELYIENRVAFKNEALGFGGVPTTLLVLALLFFAAAAGLAVCYIRRYVKAFPFTNKNQQKEMIETKAVEEEKADDGNLNAESTKIDKKLEEPKSPPKTTVRYLEAEV